MTAPGLPGPGTRLGHYELIRLLGRGGMGSVHLARDLRLGRRVAIKFLTSGSAQVGERFRTEARATARCQHPNIVIIHDVGEYQSRQYMVLEHVTGQTLRNWLSGQQDARETGLGGGRSVQVNAASAGVTPARAVELMVPVVRALVRAHEMGIVHRDLKPGNIMLTEDGQVKVLDFGVAMLRQAAFAGDTQADHGAAEGGSVDEHGGFSPSTLVGTPAYMSPEQLEARDVDHQSDIWAVGVMLYEMVVGVHPLGPCTARELMEVADVEVPMPRASELLSTAGAPGAGPLAGVIDRCLLKDKCDRIADARALLAELEPLMPGHGQLSLTGDDSPFVGLSAFQEGDADRFFGRDEDTQAVVSRVREQPLVAVIGPSGAGKSSLVRAGVIPALERSGEGWQSLITRPGRSPLGALARVLGRVQRSSTSSSGGLRALTNETALAGDSSDAKRATVMHLRVEPGYLGAELRDHAQRKLRRVVLFVDQFEELYTLCLDEDERTAFLACLAGAADDAESPLRVVLSMRADFLERVAENRAFMALATRGLMLLPPMGRVGLQAALEKPLEAAGYRFESGDTVSDMLAGLEATGGALPLLQFAATTLWKERNREQRLLTAGSYRAMGGIAGALAKHADAVVAGMPSSQVALARAVFERLVTPERTRAIASLAELRELPGDSDAIEQAVHSLADARLVVIETGGSDGSSVEIVHESLIASWPTLRRWLEENQEDAVFLARLRTAAKQWDKSERSAGMLWRDEAASEAASWYQRYQGRLAELEKEFLKAVFALAERSRRRKRRNLVIGMVVLLSLAVLSTIGFVLVSNARDRAERDRMRAVADQEQAETKQQKAETARQKAVLDQSRAVEEKKRAEKEKGEAVEEKSKAESARRVAEADQRQLRRNLAGVRKRTDELKDERNRLLAEAARLEKEQNDLRKRTAHLQAEKTRLLTQKRELERDRDEHERELRNLGVEEVNIDIERGE